MQILTRQKWWFMTAQMETSKQVGWNCLKNLHRLFEGVFLPISEEAEVYPLEWKGFLFIWKYGNTKLPSHTHFKLLKCRIRKKPLQAKAEESYVHRKE